jgi:hypothetical protein
MSDDEIRERLARAYQDEFSRAGMSVDLQFALEIIDGMVRSVVTEDSVSESEALERRITEEGVRLHAARALALFDQEQEPVVAEAPVPVIDGVFVSTVAAGQLIEIMARGIHATYRNRGRTPAGISAAIDMTTVLGRLVATGAGEAARLPLNEPGVKRMLEALDAFSELAERNDESGLRTSAAVAARNLRATWDTAVARGEQLELGDALAGHPDRGGPA